MIDNLCSFGLTRIEATIYITLLSHGAMTGYEIAKETGISRSNVYNSLATLVEKGAAYTMQEEASKFIPVKVETFLHNTLKELEKKADFIIQHAPKPVEQETGYITIKGSRHIKDKISEMLNSTELRLYIMAESSLILKYKSQLIALTNNEKKVVILTDKDILEKDGSPKLAGIKVKNSSKNNDKDDGKSDSKGDGKNANKKSQKNESVIYITELQKGQLRLISDSKYVLTGEATGSESDTCLYSGQPHLISIMKEALKNKITLLQQDN